MVSKDQKKDVQATPAASRRKFLTGAAVATTGAAITGFPMISPLNSHGTRYWGYHKL